MRDIAVVALDINRANENFKNFESLSAVQKIELLEQRIIQVCNDLKTKEPNSMWIITWREYGITEGLERSLSPEMKSLFKTRMENLVKQFSPNLTIAAGTIASQKQRMDPKKLEELEKFYQEHAWIKEREKYLTGDNPQQMEKELEKLQILKSAGDGKEYTVVRNTCYVFSQETWRHDKIAPYKETKEFTSTTREIFQPGKGRNLNPYCQLIHPVSKEKIKLGIEICRENAFANLQKLNSNEMPDFQLVISDSIAINLRGLWGKYIIQLDSFYKPRLYVRTQKVDSLPVRLYQTDLTASDYTLKGPLQGSYPFEMQVIDKLSRAIHLLPTKNQQRNVLMEIYDHFIKVVKENKGLKPESVFTALESILDAHEKDLQSPLSYPSSLSSASTFTPPPNINFLLQELHQLIEIERNKKLTSCDFMGRGDALLLDKIKLFELALDENDEKTAFMCINDHGVLEKMQLSILRTYQLLNLINGNQEMLPADKKDYYHRIFANMREHLFEPHVSFDNKTLLHIMCETNMAEALTIALGPLREKVNLTFAGGETLLHYALRESADEKVIRVLLENGADITIENDENKTALQLAEQFNHPALQLLHSFPKSTLASTSQQQKRMDSMP